MDVAPRSLDDRPVDDGWSRASDGRSYPRESRVLQTSRAGVSSAMRWLQLAVLMLGIGGACLMLYGNAQNNTGGSGRATITGTVVVIVVGMLVALTSIAGERRSRRQHTP